MRLLELISLLIFAYWAFSAWEWWRYALDYPMLGSIEPFDHDAEYPSVAIILSARDEEQEIGAAVTKLLEQDYPNYRLIVVDDDSQDSTGKILDEFKSNILSIIHLKGIPPQGWLGKTYALHHAALTSSDKYILFTDADVNFAPDTLKRVIAYAERTNADHLVTFPALIYHSWGEKIVGYAFSLFLIQSGKPWNIENPNKYDGLGVGAFNLVRRESFLRFGGFEKFSLNVDDDVTLGRMIKAEGFQTRIVWSRGAISCHWQEGWRGMVHGLEKNFFPALRCNLWFAAAALTALFLLFIWPYFVLAGALITSNAFLLYISLFTLLAKFALACAIAPLERGSNPWFVFTLPLGAASLMLALVNSVQATLRNGGIRWRGRFYPIADLRRGYFNTFRHYRAVRRR